MLVSTRAAMKRCWLLGLGVALLALPPLVAGGLEVVRASARMYPNGDYALLQAGVHEAARGRLLLGAYSRFGWHHPGPLLFYYLAPSYLLSGRATVGLHIAASVLSLLALVVATAAWWRASGNTVRRRLFLVLLAVHCAVFALLWPGSVHAEIFNPVIALLPFTALLVVTIAVLAGAYAWLPLAFLLHALVSQSHAEYAPGATVASIVAAVAYALGGPERKPCSRGGYGSLQPRPCSSAGCRPCWTPPCTGEAMLRN